MHSSRLPFDSSSHRRRRTNGDQKSQPDVRVIVVGAGFSGLCMAAQLRREGEDSFLVLEKSAGVGGTWRDSIYPGCTSDIPSHLYSLSFVPKTDWSRLYPSQPELAGYLNEIVEKYDLRSNIRLNTKMESAAWDEARSLWIVRTGDGSEISAAVLVLAIGVLHVPALPRLNGIEKFEGVAFHSSEWRDGCQLSGKKVAVIGTGASAVQFVPEIAGQVDKLVIYQRNAPWVFPKHDRPIGALEKSLLRRVPGFRLGFRFLIYLFQESLAQGLNGNMRKIELGEKLAREFLERQIADPKMRERLTPNYRLGCKRILISNDYYSALVRENVELVTEPIREIKSDRIIAMDGTEHPADVIIFGTGFQAVETFRKLAIRGRDGVSLGVKWKDEIRSYYGLCVNGFPNFFMLLGPNTVAGNNSAIYMIEAQVEYVLRCLLQMRRRSLASIDVKSEVQNKFYHQLQERLGRTLWQVGGCRSWYQDQERRNCVLWPGFTFTYRWRTRRSGLSDFDVRSAHH